MIMKLKFQIAKGGSSDQERLILMTIQHRIEVTFEIVTSLTAKIVHRVKNHLAH